MFNANETTNVQKKFRRCSPTLEHHRDNERLNAADLGAPRLSAALWDFDTLQLDASLSCPGRRDSSCAHWDHTVQLFVCCDPLGPYCNTELGRWITAFRR